MKDNKSFKEKLIDVCEKDGMEIEKSTQRTQEWMAIQQKRAQSFRRAAVFSWVITGIFYIMWRILNAQFTELSMFNQYLYDYDKTLTVIAELIHSSILWESWVIIAGLLTTYAYKQSRRLTLQQILYRLTAIENKIENTPPLSQH